MSFFLPNNFPFFIYFQGKWSTNESSCWIKQWQVTKEADKAKVEQLKRATKAFADWKKAGKAKGFGQRIGGRLGWLSLQNSSSSTFALDNQILSPDHPAVLQFHRIIFNRTLVPPYYDHLLLFIFYLEAYVDAVDDKENDGRVGKLPYTSPQLLSILTDCLAMFTVDFWASKDAPLGDLVLTYEKMLMLVNVDKGGGNRGGKKRGLTENGGAAAVDKSGTKKKVKVVTKSAVADKKPTNAQSSQSKKGKENVEGDASGNAAAAATPQSSQGSTSGGGHRSALFTQCIKKGTMRTSVKPVRKVFTPEGSQSYPSQRYYSYLTSK